MIRNEIPKDIVRMLDLIDEIQIRFTMLDQLLKGPAREAFMQTPQDELSYYHMSFGLWIRNNMLCNDKQFVKKFKKVGLTQPDEMSHFILVKYHQFLNMWK